MATCRIHEIDKKYEKIKCSREPWDRDLEGLCLLHSRQPNKDGDKAFTGAITAKLESEDYDFKGVFFSGDFSLRELTGQDQVTFAKPADFSDATFQGRADFSVVTFQEVNFAGAFFQKADFNSATFLEAFFSGATFKASSDFRNATFKKSSGFHTATFNGGTDFRGAIFKEKADFSIATFKGMADFRRSNFADGDFSAATFEKMARFRVAIFTYAFFSQAKFFGYANFVNANFFDADFSESSFRQVTDFSWAIFQKRADFVGANFQETIFLRATFQEAIFSGATFSGQARFVGINPQKEGKPPPPVPCGDFSHLSLDQEAALVFQDISLSQFKFTGTDLRRVEFHNVTWARRHGQNVVYDEILLHRTEKRPPKESYARVEELYRQLKLNYEKEGDFKNAGDFHYGEMEMHRRANPGQVWYQFYWALSGYGERPLRALLALLIMFIGFSGLFLVLDPYLFGCSLLASLGNALLYVFQKGTLQRPDFPKQAGIAAQVLGAIIPVLIPGQVALFFLALRNRLGRRR